jgi:tryptophan synthase beta chain
MACAFYGLDCKIFMVKASTEQKPYRKVVMETYGSTVIASPSMETNSGRKMNQDFPGTGGSLGCAITEAIEVAVTSPGYKYVLGSVLNHVLMHQSIIGQEVQTAMNELGIAPDIIIGCAGGGSNLGGLIAPFMGARIRGENKIRFIAVEPASCPSLTRGKYAYDFGDTGMTTPLLRMYTLGSGFMPSPNHAGGLRYHGMSGTISKLYHDGLIEGIAVEQNKVFDAATLFARTETVLPAPESAHAIKVAIDEALKCKETGEEKTILFNLSGTGYFDMTAYASYVGKSMTDGIPTDEELKKGFESLPKIPQNK